MTAEADQSAQPMTILECTPPTRLIVESVTPDGPWRLAAHLHGDNGGTTLRFVQQLAEPYDASSIGPGWQFYLDRLGAVIEGTPVPDAWDDYFPALQDAYPIPR